MFRADPMPRAMARSRSAASSCPRCRQAQPGLRLSSSRLGPLGSFLSAASLLRHRRPHLDGHIPLRSGWQCQLGGLDEELSVKVVGRKVVLVGQKETQNVDEKGSFSYKYEVLKREWDVPEEVDAEALTCSLSKDGQLLIEAPKLALPAAPERSVPIQVSPAAPLTGPASENGATKAQV
uniref:SHSP domain-containing protein n=1 Tax=Junco hyemalis TaxID=40217 RepID=A0A8C5NPV4_JUNHY